MTKNRLLVLLLIVLNLFNLAKAQTLNYYNPYIDYNNHALLLPNNNSYRARTYDGEYVLFYNNHPWQLWNTGQYAKSYSIEVVSFPFIPDEFTSTSNTRNLTIPNPLTFNGIDSWVGAISGLTLPIYKMHSNQSFLSDPISNYYSTESINSIHVQSSEFPSSLISVGFESQSFQIVDRIIYPHSILKHTIYIHCGPNLSDPIIDKLEFIIDHTRGTMRKYPFVNSNFNGGSATTHDITVFPLLVLDYNDYDETTLSTDLNDPYHNYIPIDAINYFPYLEPDPSVCSNFCPAIPFDIYNTFPDAYIHPNPNSISGFMLLNVLGNQYAGFKPNVSGSALEPIGGMKQNYFIDKPIDLNSFNQIEKTVYNPSEVSISTNLIFPANYTFKTVRGVVPTVSDVDLDNTVENGGPFSDKRDVPVITDLFYDGNDPAYPTNDHRYSSIYKIEDGASITIEPCVKLFDCTFDLKQGSEIIFENWLTNQINHNRYMILLDGGKITKRSDNWLFQNEMESRSILNFEGADFIRAGNNVDINRPTGDYIVDTGAQIYFSASNQIILDVGFSAKLGSDFEASIKSVSVPGCPNRITRPNDNDIYSVNTNLNENLLFVFPNIITEASIIRLNIKKEDSYSLYIFNSMGQLKKIIFEQKILKVNNYNIHEDISDLISGMYLCKLVSSSSESTAKVIKVN